MQNLTLGELDVWPETSHLKSLYLFLIYPKTTVGELFYHKEPFYQLHAECAQEKYLPLDDLVTTT